MTGPSLASAGLDERRRRILFRAWRRGLREMDLVMGQFADAHLITMTDAELGEFERMLDVSDPDIFAWIMGDANPPAEFDTPMLARLAAAPREALRRESQRS